MSSIVTTDSGDMTKRSPSWNPPPHSGREEYNFERQAQRTKVDEDTSIKHDVTTLLILAVNNAINKNGTCTTELTTCPMNQIPMSNKRKIEPVTIKDYVFSPIKRTKLSDGENLEPNSDSTHKQKMYPFKESLHSSKPTIVNCPPGQDSQCIKADLKQEQTFLSSSDSDDGAGTTNATFNATFNAAFGARVGARVGVADSGRLGQAAPSKVTASKVVPKKAALGLDPGQLFAAFLEAKFGSPKVKAKSNSSLRLKDCLGHETTSQKKPSTSTSAASSYDLPPKKVLPKTYMKTYSKDNTQCFVHAKSVN